MLESTRTSIRQIFLNPRPFVALITAAGLLAISFQALKREIAEGTIVAGATGMGVRVPRREMMAAAMRTWAHEIIEEALGEDAAQVLPEAIRLVALDVGVSRYQRDMVRYVAERDGTTVTDVVARELEGMASAGFEEFVGVVPGFAEAVGFG